MSKISEHIIGTSNGALNLIDWTAGAENRFYPIFDATEQLGYAKQIAKVKDEKSRELMLELLEKAAYHAIKVEKAREEFKTINVALTKINQQLDENHD